MLMTNEQLQILRLLLQKAEKGELELMAVVFSDGTQVGHVSNYDVNALTFLKAIGKFEQMKFHFMRELEAMNRPIEKPTPQVVMAPSGPVTDSNVVSFPEKPGT